MRPAVGLFLPFRSVRVDSLTLERTSHTTAARLGGICGKHIFSSFQLPSRFLLFCHCAGTNLAVAAFVGVWFMQASVVRR